MRVVNAPGRFDRSSRLLRLDVERWTNLPGVSAVFFTETAAETRAEAPAADGWTTTRTPGGSKGECAVMTKDAARVIVESRLIKLTEGGGRGRLARPIHAPVVITRAPSGRLTLFTTCHMPAHLERRWALLPGRLKVKVLLGRPSLSPVVRTWLEAATTWRQRVTHLAAELHVDDVVVAADWNLNARRPWVRDLMAHLWPGLALVQTAGSDLGSRNIGWLMTNMTFESGKVHSAAASDHDAGEFQLRHLNVPPVDPKPVKPPDPFERCTYNGALMDQKTKTFVQCCEKRLGYPLTIAQGCYNPGGVSASAGTHDGGGVIDLAPFDWDRKDHVWRAEGGFGWKRPEIPGVWQPHHHGGIRNHGRLSPSAARQQDDFDAKPPRNGLADHAVDTSGLHPDPPAHFDYAEAWREVNSP